MSKKIKREKMSQYQDILKVGSESFSDIEDDKKRGCRYPRIRISHKWHLSRPMVSKKVKKGADIPVSGYLKGGI